MLSSDFVGAAHGTPGPPEAQKNYADATDVAKHSAAARTTPEACRSDRRFYPAGCDAFFGSCGRCLLVQTQHAAQPEWSAVVMKKSRCPPWTNHCGANKKHLDIAVPGFDDLRYSTANVCGMRPGTGFASQNTSSVIAGSDWYRAHSCGNATRCQEACSLLPLEFQKGCRFFASWGWETGSPKVNYTVVPCPQRFLDHVERQFGRVQEDRREERGPSSP